MSRHASCLWPLHDNTRLPIKAKQMSSKMAVEREGVLASSPSAREIGAVDLDSVGGTYEDLVEVRIKDYITAVEGAPISNKHDYTADS
jgi:hypothetical protein